MSPRHVVVVGGGLAGISAALRCCDSGLSVTVLEARPWLGGATFSFERDGLSVDNGQHALLRCYSAYRGLLDRLGMGTEVDQQDRFALPLLTPGGRPVLLRRARLPAPAHLAPALLGHRLLSVSERLRAMRTARAMTRLDPEDPALDQRSFGDWLRTRGESARSTDALWGLLTVAALNAHPDHASLALAVRVFRTGLLDRADASDIGLPAAPLGRLHGDAAHRALTEAGAAVRLRCPASALRRTARGWQVMLPDERSVHADAVIVAVPHQAAAPLLREHSLPGVETWTHLSATPIVNVHVVYDRPVTDLAFAAVVGSPVQWVFDRTAVAGAVRGQYLAISLSAADEYVNARTEALRDVFLPALNSIFPAAARAEVLDFFITRQPRATFRQAPGTRRLRPRPMTPLPGLVLAGAWIDTGWPDTMEGAVRSGETAADLVNQQGTDRSVQPLEVTA